MFDNATNHNSFKSDALVAKRMQLARGGKHPLLSEGFDYERGLPQAMVFVGNHPNHSLQGKAKGLQHVLTERGLWPVNSRCSDDFRFLLECPTAHGLTSCPHVTREDRLQDT